MRNGRSGSGVVVAARSLSRRSVVSRYPGRGDLSDLADLRDGSCAGRFTASRSSRSPGFFIEGAIRQDWGDLQGLVSRMFAIVMISSVDLALQNPVTSSESDTPITRYLPSYGAMQAATAAGFSHTAVPRYVLIQSA
ncbi:hypothetical protein ACFZAV_30870 [Streptomyces sp. NPDC008343]|uniref:hypothetical protein n=1 Tax=Streptomyces sp. NPDC008343 TaxID=3364828 RepID=UPI0036EF87A3